MMHEHLQRALIETCYAIAEYNQQRTSPGWGATEAETLALGNVLMATRATLENVLNWTGELASPPALKAYA